MGRDCPSERGQRLEHDRLRGAPGRSWGLLEERALPTPGGFTERLGVRGGTAKAGTRWRFAGVCIART